MQPFHRRLLSTSLLAAAMICFSGCDAARGLRGENSAQRSDAPPPAPERPAADRERADGAAVHAREKRYREAIVRAVLDNARISRLIPRKPPLGGSWRVSSREDIQFLGSGVVAIDYEDGHVAGRLLVQVNDPHDLTTWKVLEDRPE